MPGGGVGLRELGTDPGEFLADQGDLGIDAGSGKIEGSGCGGNRPTVLKRLADTALFLCQPYRRLGQRVLAEAGDLPVATFTECREVRRTHEPAIGDADAAELLLFQQAVDAIVAELQGPGRLLGGQQLVEKHGLIEIVV